MSVTLGLWILPFFVSLAACVWVALGDYQPRGDYDFGTPILGLLKMSAALIASLVAWLIWALLS